MSDFDAALTRALAARDARDDRRYLAALLDAWRAVPDLELADLICEVSQRFEPPEVIVPSRGQRLKTWLHAMQRGAPEELPTLLSTVRQVNWQGHAYNELKRVPPDPRIERAWPWLTGTRPPPTPPQPVPHDALALHEQVVRPLRERRAAERPLLERIWGDPDDDAARQVYADWLLERGDPRGELIALQLAGQDNARAQKLLRRWSPEWLGVLEPLFYGAWFARGFLDSGILNWDLPFRDIVGRPEWSTVTLLNYAGEAAEPIVDLFTHPVMRGLRQVHGMRHATIVALASRGVRTGLHTLGFTMASPSAREAAILAEGEVFPAVRSAYVGGDRDALTWLPGSAFAARLTLLSVVCFAAAAPLWLRDLGQGRLPGLGTLSLSLREGGTLAVEGDAARATRIPTEFHDGLRAALPPGKPLIVVE